MDLRSGKVPKLITPAVWTTESTPAIASRTSDNFRMSPMKLVIGMRCCVWPEIKLLNSYIQVYNKDVNLYIYIYIYIYYIYIYILYILFIIYLLCLLMVITYLLYLICLSKVSCRKLEFLWHSLTTLPEVWRCADRGSQKRQSQGSFPSSNCLPEISLESQASACLTGSGLWQWSGWWVESWSLADSLLRHQMTLFACHENAPIVELATWQHWQTEQF